MANSQSVDDIYHAIAEQQNKAAFQADEDKKILCDTLTKSMITNVVIEFSGSGDSGQIDNIEIEYVEDKYKLSESKEKLLRRNLSDWTYLYLEGVGLDWYNNEGGQGSIEFNLRVVPFKFKSTVDVNYMETRTEHEHEEAI